MNTDRYWDSGLQRWIYPEHEATFSVAVEAMRRLPDDARLRVMSAFCRGCGCDNPRCQCDNDE